MQEHATQLHSRIHGEEKPVDLKGLISQDEKVIHTLKTVGFERFPGSGDTMIGDGMVILTDKNIYFHHYGNSNSASGNESAFGSTKCPAVCCLGKRGCCACISSCEKTWGNYTHVATRETRSALTCVGIEDQVMDVYAEQVLNSRLERKFQFYPAISAGGCQACCMYACNMCCMCCTMCCKITDSCVLDGYVTFQYETEYNKKQSLEQNLIKEAKIGDSSFWTPFEVEKLMNCVMRNGGPDKMTDKLWFDLVTTELTNKKVEACKEKVESLLNGYSAMETAKTGSYRALYVPFLDGCGTGKIREAVCIIDAKHVKTEDLYKFVISCQKLRNRGPPSQVKNTMDESGYPSRSLRSKILAKPSLFGGPGGLLSGILGMLPFKIPGLG